MSDPGKTNKSQPSRSRSGEAASRSDAAREAERRRRHASVFGDVLPDGARDEEPGAWGDRDSSGGRSDEWYRDEVPPHHG